MLGDEEAGSVHAFRRLVRGREMREEGSNCSTCQKGHVFRSVSSPPKWGCIQISCSSVANHHCEKPDQVLRENQWSATFNKKKSEKMKMKFWTLPRRPKSTKMVPHPCQAEQTSSQGGNQLWAERQASLPGSLLNIRELPATPQIHTATTVASTQMPALSHFLCSSTLEEELQDSDYSER